MPAGAFLRLDIPGDDGDVATQFYNPSAVYAMTPVSEEMARQVAKAHRPAPVTRWELPPASVEEAEDRHIQSHFDQREREHDLDPDQDL